MAPSTIRKALGAVKDQASIGLAKMAGGSVVELEVNMTIVKVTRHGESLPAEYERQVQEIMMLTCYSRAHVAACVASLARRLGRTRSWAVALKTLVLVHRLLVDGDPAYEQEVFFATRHGKRILNLSGFLDRSCASGWDSSAFVRTYAAYLNDRLEYRMQGRREGACTPGKWRLIDHCSPFHHRDNFYWIDGRYKEREAEAEEWALVTRGTPETKIRLEDLFAKARHLQHLLDRFLACRPTGAAKKKRLVLAALYPVVKESVQMYCGLTEVMAVLIDRFAEMEIADCVRVHAIFSSLAKLINELDSFYSWCKVSAVCLASDIPEVERVTQKKLDLMDEFIRERCAGTLQRRRSPPRQAQPVEEHDKDVNKTLPASERVQVAVKKEDHIAGETAPAETADLLIVADALKAKFLNKKEDVVMSGEEHGEKLALALFDGNPEESAPKWEAFDDSSDEWETALVQSASRLATQRAELGGGFNMMVLDGMYSYATTNATVANAREFAGSASSVAMRPAGTPMLALPAPLGNSGAAAAASAEVDPFAASLAVPPPTFVQMSDLQTKQQLFAEHMLWQQYEVASSHGQGSLAKLGAYNYFGQHQTYVL